MTADPEAEDAPPERARYPSGISFIVGNEGAERFSYYGMRAVLYMYLTSLYVLFQDEALVPAGELAAAKAHGTEVAHLFFAGAYLFPLLGAIVSDRLLGKFNVIFWVSLLYCVGHGTLAVAGRLGAMGEYGAAESGMYIGLVLIAVGAGGIKPCVSANVGDQFSEHNSQLVTKIFQIFYFMINFGSFFSTIITPLLYRYVGAEVAFGVPGILMGVATVVFWLGRKRFVRVPPKPGGSLGLLDTCTTTLLLSPIFSLIFGYFIMWEEFEAPEGVSGLALIAPVFGHYWWLLVVTGVAVVIGFVLFSVRQKKEADNGFLAVLLYAVRNQRQRKPGQTFFDPAREKFGEEAGDGPPAVFKIILVFSMVSVFWALFDQHASTWVEQAKQMHLVLTVPTALWYASVGGTIALVLYGAVWLFLHVANVVVPRVVNVLAVGAVGAALVVAAIVDTFLGGTKTVELEYAQVQALNPMMVMIIIPLLNVAVWNRLQQRGITVGPLVKMTIGMFLAAVAFVMAAMLQSRIEAAGPGQVPVLWQVPQYFIMTTSEVLVSITGLEFAYTQAPRAMKSTIMGFWFLCVTIGNLIVAFLAPLQEIYDLSHFFWIFAALMAVAAVVFTIMAYFYKGKTYLQGAGGEE